MGKLENYGLVIFTIILALMPLSFHVVIGFPAGIWALVILSRKDVRAGFAANLRRSQGSLHTFDISPLAPQEPKPAGRVYAMLRSAIGGMLTLIVHRPTRAGLSKPGQEAEAGNKTN